MKKFSLNSILRKYFIIIFITLSGCAVRPHLGDIDEYFDKKKAGNRSVTGSLVVINNLDLYKYTPEPDPYSTLRREIKREKINFVEAENNLEFKFIFNKCLEKDSYPTNYYPVNLLIFIATFTLKEVGTKYDCKIDLEVTNYQSKEKKFFTTDIEMVSAAEGLVGFLKSAGQYGPVARWGLPVKRLLKMYSDAQNN